MYNFEEHNFIYNRVNYFKCLQNVPNRYLFIVKKFRNNSFIIFNIAFNYVIF